ncbi:MAG: AsmA-like C-terminal domain-containing protein [Magnetospirillum sp.]|nr:AsmA-like C-terminal domain-containing protein [Magnetospirillum sp.]
MVHGAVRHLFQLLGALVVVLLIGVPLSVWRLSNGPVALDFLTPYIEAALTDADGRYAVRLDRTVLALDRGRRLLEIRAVNVVAFAGGDKPVATVPQVAMNFSGRALLRGNLVPRAVRVYNPKITLVRDESGRLSWGIGDKPEAEPSNDVVRGLVDELVGAQDPSKPGRLLQSAAILGADVVVDDRALHTVWHAPDVDLEMKRSPVGIQALAHVSLDLDGQLGTVGARVDYLSAGGGIDGEMRLSNIRPMVLARFGGPLASLSALDMPLEGTVRGKATADGTVSEIAFDLSGDAGVITLPAPVSATYRVAGTTLRGRLTNNLAHADIDELGIDFGGPRVTVAARIDGLGGDTVINADGTVREVPFDSLPGLWPAAVAPEPRAWVVANLHKGVVREGHVTVSARSPSGRLEDLEIGAVTGDLHGEGATVDYLHPMPPVRNASASATFDSHRFRITVDGGEADGLKVDDGVIELSGLDQAVPAANVDLTISGAAADALKLIDHPPLRYAQALGIKPDRIGGKAVTRLRLTFPLLANLKIDDLSVKAHSVIDGARVPGVLMGLDLSQGHLALDVDARGMDVTGPVVLGTIPARLAWRENFTRNAPFRSRYVVDAPSVDEQQRRSLGLDSPPFVAPWLEGPVGATVTATLQPGGRADVDAKMDLSPAHMSLPGLGWRKERRTTGGAQALVRIVKGRIAAVPRFSLIAGDLQAQGSIAFRPDGTAQRVDFDRMAFGRTDLAGTVAFLPGGALNIAFKGTSFDAKPLLSSHDSGSGEDGGGNKEPPAEDDLPVMDVSVAAKSLWLSTPGRLIDGSATLRHEGGDWRAASIRGTVSDGKTFSAVLRQDSPGRRSVTVVSDDAGGVMRAFDVYDDVVGGALDIAATIRDDEPAKPVSGVVRITDYSVVHAPPLARLLTVAALTGIVDLLRGEGVSFSVLDAPFTLTDGVLEVTNARAHGTALGLTANGQIDLNAGRLALEGTVVPIYSLNGALGNIPLLGWLTTGGEKGGGLVAFNFSMKGSTQEPDVVVNPLSALAPGFLRRFFDIFDSGSETVVRPKAASP